jgi:hypothetical protein
MINYWKRDVTHVYNYYIGLFISAIIVVVGVGVMILLFLIFKKGYEYLITHYNTRDEKYNYMEITESEPIVNHVISKENYRDDYDMSMTMTMSIV